MLSLNTQYNCVILACDWLRGNIYDHVLKFIFQKKKPEVNKPPVEQKVVKKSEVKAKENKVTLTC